MIILFLARYQIQKSILIQIQQNAAHLCRSSEGLKEDYVLQNTAICRTYIQTTFFCICWQKLKKWYLFKKKKSHFY